MIINSIFKIPSFGIKWPIEKFKHTLMKDKTFCRQNTKYQGMFDE